MLEQFASAARRQPWTLYPVSDEGEGEPIDVGPVDDPSVTIATVNSIDDARFIVAVRNYLPAMLAEMNRQRDS